MNTKQWLNHFATEIYWYQKDTKLNAKAWNEFCKILTFLYTVDFCFLTSDIFIWRFKVGLKMFLMWKKFVILRQQSKLKSAKARKLCTYLHHPTLFKTYISNCVICSLFLIVNVFTFFHTIKVTDPDYLSVFTFVKAIGRKGKLTNVITDYSWCERNSSQWFVVLFLYFWLMRYFDSIKYYSGLEIAVLEKAAQDSKDC